MKLTVERRSDTALTVPHGDSLRAPNRRVSHAS
jgi:hypothetical protein